MYYINFFWSRLKIYKAKQQIRKVEEDKSPLVAFAINEGNSTTLITPHGEYLFAQWGLVRVKPVTNYAERVAEEL